jgi:hypothetical protein
MVAAYFTGAGTVMLFGDSSPKLIHTAGLFMMIGGFLFILATSKTYSGNDKS